LDHEVTETVNMNTAGPDPRTLSVVGVGRAGGALAVAAAGRGWTVEAVAGRSPARTAAVAAALGARQARTAAEAARFAQLTLIAVPDSQVSAVAARIAAAGIALRGHVVAHCAASLGLDVLAAVRQTGAMCGVVHPLQALTGAAGAELIAGSYFRVEGDADAMPLLRDFVSDLGGNLLDVPSRSRVLYHAAAVLAGNAPLALLERATELLVEAGVNPADAHAALSTLLEGSARNARRQGPAAALTGPVSRNDAATVRAHLDALAVDADTRDLYIRLAREMLLLAGQGGREAVSDVLDAGGAPPRPRIAASRVA
jgi:predicted short-subunit dehydrogenase-like oxidoreductase (DUF2520 family)